MGSCGQKWLEKTCQQTLSLILSSWKKHLKLSQNKLQYMWSKCTKFNLYQVSTGVWCKPAFEVYISQRKMVFSDLLLSVRFPQALQTRNSLVSHWSLPLGATFLFTGNDFLWGVHASHQEFGSQGLLLSVLMLKLMLRYNA